jgi:hypothetical protein
MLNEPASMKLDGCQRSLMSTVGTTRLPESFPHDVISFESSRNALFQSLAAAESPEIVLSKIQD